MKKSMQGFIDPYGLSLLVVLIGAFTFDIQDSFESRNNNDDVQQVSEPKQESKDEYSN